MDSTRIIPPAGDDRTQLVNPGSQQSPLASDPQRTQYAAPPLQGVQLQCLVENQYANAARNERSHLLVQVQAPDAAYGRRLPLNLCLCIDRSGSMEGEPLNFVKQACAYVVDLLEPNDVLSVVTFAEDIEVVMPARRVVNRQLIKEHIMRIDTGNTTNLYDGILTAGRQVASVQSPAYLNRLLVLTDGEPTVGIKDFQSIVGQVAELKSRGISVTALGFGPDYNEELMAGIARRSGGNYYFVSRPDLIPEVFRKELETLMTVVAKGLRLQLNLTRWTQVRQVYGMQPVNGPRSLSVDLVDLERGAQVTALAELDLARRPAGTYRIAQAVLSYDDLASGRTQQLCADAVVEFVTDESRIAAGVNPLVQREVEVAQASRSLERTVMGIKTQALTSMAAIAELERTQSLLAAQGRVSQAQEVTQAINSIRQGNSGTEAEKTLMGTILDLEQGRRE
ncbi:MAG TPA: VWA domain-containing protein [Armatimonadota bacterium]|nr:VWA domain-containing protein [Armatimonadota bacterium]